MRKVDTQALQGRARGKFAIAIALLAIAGIAAADAQDAAFKLDPQGTTVNFTLGDVLHTVRGTFRLK